MENLTLTGLLKKSAFEFPESRALSVPGKCEFTHSRLNKVVDQAADLLVAHGVRPGDAVALTFPNSVEVCVFGLIEFWILVDKNWILIW